jgi:sugar-specific transcriptional regulator TrmB
MLASVKVMDALKGIGLNLYERRLWVALLARGTSTAGELSEIASVPRSRTYDVLQSLAEKGFVVVQTAKPIRYIAISPEESLERAKRKLEENFKETIEKIDDMKGSPIMRELNEVFSQGLKIITPEEMTGALKGKYSLNQQMDTMIRNADKHINIVTTPEGLNELFSNHVDALRKAKERGVNIKIVTSGKEGVTEAVKSLGSIAEVRNTDNKESDVAGRFVVVDDKQFILALTDSKTHSTQDMSLWSKSEHASGNVLSPLFKMVWSKSKPLS